MTLYVEPMQDKWYIRFLAAAPQYFVLADDADLDVPASRDMSIMVVFRTVQTAAPGTMNTILEKTGVGPTGGANVGYSVVINANTGQLRLLLNTDDGFGGTTPINIYSTSIGLNDGQVHVAIFSIDRVNNAYAVYLGNPCHVALNSTGDMGNHTESLANDGAFVTLFYGGGDLFSVRIFNGLALTAAMVAALDGDLARPVDTHGIAGLVYTDDPSVTGGCILELIKDRPTDGNYNLLEDTAGEAKNLTENVGGGIEDMRVCWDKFPLPVDSATLNSSYSIASTSVKRSRAIQYQGLWHGDRSFSVSDLRDRSIGLDGRYLEATRAARETARAAVVDILRRRDIALYDDGVADYPHGFVVADAIEGLDETLEPLGPEFSQMPLTLKCSDPHWRLNYKIGPEITCNAGNSYTYTQDVLNSGNVPAYPKFFLFSGGDPQGYVLVENLRTGKYFTVGEVEQTDIWDAAGNDQGKCILVDCLRSQVWWMDGRVSKMLYFLPEFFTLEPGYNPIRITAAALAGPIGPATLYTIIDFWELRL